MPEPLTAVAHLITGDAPLLGPPSVDVLPVGVPLGEQKPVWSRRVPPAYSRDVDAYLRGLTALGWPPIGQPVEVEHGYAVVNVQAPAEHHAALQARPGPRPRAVRPGNLEDLADELGVDPGDVRVMLDRLGVDETAMTDAVGACVRADLDQYCVRTAPTFWWPGSDPDAGRGATLMTFDHRRSGK